MLLLCGRATADDREALLEFADTTDPGREVLFNWNETVATCSFWGVKCTSFSTQTSGMPFVTGM